MVMYTKIKPWVLILNLPRTKINLIFKHIQSSYLDTFIAVTGEVSVMHLTDQWGRITFFQTVRLISIVQTVW